MSTIQYDKIPNNVDLRSNKKLQKALEAWQPAFIDWWKEVGPVGFQQDDIYLRTAVSVEPSGWAKFDYVKMPDYRWGIFLTPAEKGRTIGFGDNAEREAWDQVPGSGEVYSYTTVHRPVAADQTLPFVIAVIALEDSGGLRMISNLVDVNPEELEIGMPVELVWEDMSADLAIPRFRPMER